MEINSLMFLGYLDATVMNTIELTTSKQAVMFYFSDGGGKTYFQLDYVIDSLVIYIGQV